MLTWNNVETIPIEDLKTELKENFFMVPPKEIVSANDLENTQKMLSRSTANYSFLYALAIEVKGRKRKLKREKASKEAIDDLMEREELLLAYSEISKATYQAISRMYGVYIQTYEECKYTGHTT